MPRFQGSVSEGDQDSRYQTGWRIAAPDQATVAVQPIKPALSGVSGLADFLGTYSNLTTSSNDGISSALQSLGIAQNGRDGAAGWTFNSDYEAGPVGWSLTSESRAKLAGWTIGTDNAASTQDARSVQAMDATGQVVGTVAQDTSPLSGIYAIADTVTKIGLVIAAAYALPGVGGALFGSGAAVGEGIAAGLAPLAEADAALAWGGLDAATVTTAGEGIASSIVGVPLESLASIEASVSAWAAAPDLAALLPAFEVAAPVVAAPLAPWVAEPAADVAVSWVAPGITPAAVQAEAVAAIDAGAAAWAMPDLAAMLPAFEVAAPWVAAPLDPWVAPGITPAAVQAEAVAAIDAGAAAWAMPDMAAMLPVFEVAPLVATPAFAWSTAIDSQAASTAAGITGAQAAATAVAPAAVDLGSLGGIVSTAADVGIGAAPSLGEKLAGQAVAKATTSAGNAALSKLLAALAGAAPVLGGAGPGAAPGQAAKISPMPAGPGAALLLLAGLGLLFS